MGRLDNAIKGFVHHELDLRNRQGILNLLNEIKPDAIVHTAAQPSHDLAASIFEEIHESWAGRATIAQ
jgi:CDP-paratose 2-epimerase